MSGDIRKAYFVHAALGVVPAISIDRPSLVEADLPNAFLGLPEERQAAAERRLRRQLGEYLLSCGADRIDVEVFHGDDGDPLEAIGMVRIGGLRFRAEFALETFERIAEVVDPRHLYVYAAESLLLEQYETWDTCLLYLDDVEFRHVSELFRV